MGFNTYLEHTNVEKIRTILAGLALTLVAATAQAATEIVFYHYQTGAPGKTLRTILDDFQKSNPDVVVKDIYKHSEQITGEVQVRRVVVGHDAGLLVNPQGVLQQVHGNVLQTTSRALKERLRLDPATGAVASREWGGYPILSFREVPVVEVLLMPRPGEPALGVALALRAGAAGGRAGRWREGMARPR
jgi:hypothetical protein